VEHFTAEIDDNSGNMKMRQFSNVIEIDTATLVEYDGRRISRTGDDRRHRRSDHTGR
jgi:hypothetical protein